MFLAVNHPNALVDALVVAVAVPRRVHFTAKATVFGNPLVALFLRFAGVIPLKRASDEAKRTPEAAAAAVNPSRNADSFRAVSAALTEGQVIVLFPEGKSHDDPHLAPLRTGLARMALLARDTYGVRGITIIPVGLLFEQKETPRSRALIQIGDAIEVDAVPVGDHAVESLTALVSQRLNSVTSNFASSDDAARIAKVSETLAALIEPTTEIKDGGPPLSAILALSRRTDRVRQALSDNTRAELHQRAADFQTRLDAFRARLFQERISATDVHIDVNATPGVRLQFAKF